MNKKVLLQEQALKAVKDVLFEAWGFGFQAFTSTELLRFTQVAHLCHHARLLRISRCLEGLVVVGRQGISRDPRFLVGTWVSRLDELASLTKIADRGLSYKANSEEQMEALGVARRRYLELEGVWSLTALGASGWVSERGMAGVTIYFHGGVHGILMASIVRPTMSFGATPERLWWQSITKVHTQSSFDLAHGTVQVQGLKIADHRISLHQHMALCKQVDTLAVAYGAVLAPTVAHCWGALPPPSRTEATQHAYVYFEVSRFGALTVDRTLGRTELVVFDRTGQPLVLRVVEEPGAEKALQNMPLVSALKPSGVFGRISCSEQGIVMRPYTLVFNEKVRLLTKRPASVHRVHLDFEPLSRVSR